MSAKGTREAAKTTVQGGPEPRRSENGTALAASQPANVRNVALVGHSGAGKSMLVEALLAATGAITRMGSITDGTTVSDSDPSAVHQQRSVTLSVAPILVGDVKVNLIDTPGYTDFTGELRAGLRAADAALFVVSAVDGIDGATVALWGECEKIQLPRAVVISRLDHPRADFRAAVERSQDAFGEAVLPMYLPTPDVVAGVLDPPGSADPALESALEAARGPLIEGIIAESEDETLMDRYLGGEELPLSDLLQDLETAVSRGRFFPVMPTSAETGLGLQELMSLLVDALPSPPERPAPPAMKLDGSSLKPLSCDPDGPLAAEVVRTTVDPFLGRVCLVRVFSGTLREDSSIHIGGRGLADRGHEDHDSDERVTHLYSPVGSSLKAVPYCIAGDICAISKLAGAETGDTVSDRESPLLIETWNIPEPLMPIAVEGASRSDEDALAKNIGKIAAADPTLRVERNQDTHQLILWCMGEAHAEVVLDRLRAQGVKLQTVDVITPLRETFAGNASGHGRHVKQSGGHGQFAICDIDVEPLPRGGGFEFVDKIVGGVIPATYVASVEKGIRAQMLKGVAEGFPVVDIKVTLTGGKTHSVDSSDAAFQAAGALALREAAAATRIQLLEPVSSVVVNVPDEYVGAVMSDLSGRRGRVTGTDAAPGEGAEISAEVPDQELLRYAVELRALTAGTGRFRRSYLRHEPVPK
ncbi:elongation factor G-like protein EF-G2 [Paenarthrobacter ureafaciens]|uniref:elongation factor G-like protein EF-G2 n=1 Tax=Paenarthrobacter TaxID=1742992 RepID=UPI0019171686|nr:MULTISPECIES: elongation factor G-like protein EF-G2 [Paenarthrobacter]MCW3768774.1 elongation factor G-like protein EF-G2 [Paenarthrobacter sp. PAE-2]QQQ60724.1 elongation factor G-like protein EF-G2 [Paenarthrobacter ureafaciens]